MADRPIIVLLSESPQRERRWKELLSGFTCKVIHGADLAANRSSIDIFIADCQSQIEVNSLGEGASGIHGVIGIGGNLAADVAMPDEPTERELQLACGLLFEIVQLRRERAASQQTQQKLTELAELDALTGLANRRAWNSELARRMQHACGESEGVCLALFDLDHFKEVNTAHGYAAADEVLRQTGIALKASVRSGDLVARIGGDEFGALLANISVERAEAVVERIRSSIASALKEAGAVVVTATAGFAIQNQHDDSETLFAVADNNLRAGKVRGRNRTVASTQ
ncbi:MAG: GGDEF domain-containing protein [Planctomycetes bacterium]|nr:GGDEF domain-containing protein [Planctomycetota bacterium]